MTRPRRALAALAVVVAVASLYARTLGRDYGFVFDDHALVENNEAIRDLRNVPAIFGAAAVREGPIAERKRGLDPGYRPLRMASYALDHALFGGEPRGFRLTNIVIHALNALLVLAIARRFVPGLAALLIALAFALHPAATECVTYISGRRDVLFAFFYLAAWRLFLDGREGKGARSRAAATVPLFVLALAAKETAISLPLVCLGSDLALGGCRSARAHWKTHAALFLVAVGGGAYTLLVKSPGTVEDVPRLGGSIGLAALTMARVLWHYAGLVFFPAKLTADYSFDAFPASESLFAPVTTALALAGLGAVVYAIVRAARAGSRMEAALAVLFFATLGPVSQVIVPHPEPIADRHLYVPAIFLFLLAGRLAMRAVAARPFARGALAAAAALAVLGLGARAALRNRDFRSDETLFLAAAEAYPRCARANLALADAYMKSSPPRWREALDRLDRALEVLPEEGWETRLGGLRSEALFQRASARLALDMHAEALRDLDRVLALRGPDGRSIAERPEYAHVRLNRAAALLGRGERERARAEYAAVVDLAARAPPGEQARRATIEAALQLGILSEAEPEAALAWFRRAAGDVPTGESARAWVAVGEMLYRLGRHDEAERTFEQLAGGQPADKNAWYRLAQVRVYRGNVRGARAALHVALALDPRFAAALFRLADLALAEGDLEEAERWARAALEAAPGERRAEQLLANVKLRRAAAAGPETPEEPRGARPPTDPVALAQRFLGAGEQFWKEKRYLQAVGAFAAATKHAPGLPEAWERLGRANLALGDAGEALGPLRKAVDLDPGRAAALEALVRAEILAGDPERAVEAAERLVRGVTDKAGEARRQALLASACAAAGRPEDAARARMLARIAADLEAQVLLRVAGREITRFRFARAAVAIEAAAEARRAGDLEVVPEPRER